MLLFRFHFYHIGYSGKIFSKGLASALQTQKQKWIFQPQYNPRRKEFEMIKILYMVLLLSALILSLWALWLAVKELMSE